MKSTNQVTGTSKRYTHVYLMNGDGAYDFILTVGRESNIGLADEVVSAWTSVYGDDKIATVNSNSEPVAVLRRRAGTRHAHVYIAREDGDYDYLLTLRDERVDLLPSVVRALQEGGEEVVVIESDDEPVDVLVLDAQEITERIPA